MKRTLALKREHLTPLNPQDLVGVVGGALPTTPVKYCFQDSNFICAHSRGTTCAC